MTHPGRLKTRGAGNAQAKLDVRKVIFIKQAVDHGASQTLLAKHFKVSHVQISRIISGIYWRHA